VDFTDAYTYSFIFYYIKNKENSIKAFTFLIRRFLINESNKIKKEALRQVSMLLEIYQVYLGIVRITL